MVVAETHDVLQQAALLDLRTAVVNLHTAPIGLPGHQAIAFEQIAGQHFGHRLFIHSRLEQFWRGGVVVTVDVEPIKAQAVEFMHRFPIKQVNAQQGNANRRASGQQRATSQRRCWGSPNGLTDVGTQSGLDGIHTGKPRVVEAVEVQLERLAFNDVQRLARDGEMHQRKLGFAPLVQPTELKRRPHVGTQKRQLTGKANLLPFGQTWNREQQRRVVLVNVGCRLTQLRLIG